MTAQLLFRRTWTLRYAATAAGLSSPRSPWAGRGSLGSRAAMAVQGQPPLPAESQMLEAEEESRGEKVRLPLTTATADGEQIVEWKKKVIKNQRKESRAPDDPADNLMMEMPFAETEIEAELSSKTSSKCKAYVKKKRKRITAKESEEDNVIKKKKKNQDRPNYFISVPVTDPKIVDDVQTLQKTIIQKDNRLSKAMIYYGSFHVTLLVMNLPNEEAIGNAVGAFLESRGFIEELLQGKPVDLSFQGTDHFRNQVGYVKLTKGHPTDTLLKIAVIVKMAFQEKGIFIDDKTFRPHLTFMKLSKSSKPRKQGVKRIDPTVFADFKNHYFGDELMKRLDLCSMLKKKQPNGYYHCEASIVVGEKKRAEPDDAELLSLSKRLVENAVLKAVQQYLEETQNKNRQNDCGSPVKTEEVAIGNSKKSENDIRE